MKNLLSFVEEVDPNYEEQYQIELKNINEKDSHNKEKNATTI
jgi:hypothetical protein